MNRQQKEAVVSEFKDLLKSSQAAFLVGYKGLTVKKLEALRKDLRKAGGVFKVTKARLMKIAAQEIDGVENFKNSFKDQVGLVFASGDVPPVAKTLVTFSKQNEHLNIVSGYFEAKTISQDEINYLASLPPRDVLLAQLMGTLQAPVSGFVRLLNTLIVQLLYALKQVSEKGEG